MRSMDQIFCSMSLNLRLSGVFLMITLEMGFRGENTAEVKFPPHHIMSSRMWYQHGFHSTVTYLNTLENAEDIGLLLALVEDTGHLCVNVEKANV